MKLDVQVEIDNLRLYFDNDLQVVEQMTRRLASAVKQRSAASIGADGVRWSPPKDDPSQKPASRTGQLLASISYKVTPPKKGRVADPRGSVQSKGGARKVLAAKERGTQGPRQMVKMDKARRSASAARRTDDARFEAWRKYVTTGRATGGATLKKGGGLSVRRVKRHSVVTNHNLAAILSLPPKDVAGIKGKRKKYRIYEATERDWQACFHIAESRLIPKVERAKKGRRSKRKKIR